MTDRGRRRRVLVVTNDFPPRRGGIESFVASLCERLDAADLVVLTARMPGDAIHDAALPFPVVRDRMHHLLPTPRVARVAADTARRYACDRVIFGAAAPLGLLAEPLRRAGVTRVVAMTHGHEIWWATLPGSRALFRRIVDGADVVTYVSDYCRGRLSRPLAPDQAARMTRLAPGVDADHFSPEWVGERLRDRLGLSAAAPLVVSPSRLTARKGHDVLIRAWPSVQARHPDAVLAIVGDGLMRRRLARRIAGLSLRDHVHLLPGLPWAEMPSVYAGADVLAQPCRTRLLGLEPEALGIVFLEAAACGLPVVAGRSGGTPETLIDEETGFVVDPRSPSEVAARICWLLDDRDRARAMGLAGRAHVRSAFDADRAARRLVELLAL